MTKLVVNGAQLKCSQGNAPGKLTVLPDKNTDDDDKPAATVQDYKPNVNIPSFGMCMTQANPKVASATTAAQGVLTPQKCEPVTTSPWSPGSSIVTINDQKALTDDSTCNCQWTGTIEVVDANGGVDID